MLTQPVEEADIDKSPNVLLSRFPWCRHVLHRAGVFTDMQVSAVFPPGIVHMEVRRGLPFSDASDRFVYSSHLIEHPCRWQGLGFLRALGDLAECYRLGEAPHGPTAADSLSHEKWVFREAEENPVRRAVRRRITAPHQWLNDDQSLTNLLIEAGWSQPGVRDYHAGAMPDLDELMHSSESLFIEAPKL